MSVLHLPNIPYVSDINKYISVSYDGVSDIPYILNVTLREYLRTIKGEIDGKQDIWDRYKKYTNPYEYIHTPVPNCKSSICCLKPLSRSFYKMIEMYHILNLNKLLSETYTSFHFAEGPGGFIEALCKLEETNSVKNIHYGMTLINSDDYTVPGWKKSEIFLSKHKNVIIETGADKKGDLLNPDNLLYCLNKYRGTMELVTADGGFDFSTDFNEQETSGINLIFAQILFAFAVQKKNGCFIIKFFDIFTQTSIELIYLLSIVYDHVQIINPYTSRHANSEKYIACTGFRMCDTTELVNTLCDVLHKTRTECNIPSKIFTFTLPYYFLNKLEECNAIFGQQQIENISATLNLLTTNRIEKLEYLKKINIQKCIYWCQKHKLPYNKVLPSNNIFLDIHK